MYVSCMHVCIYIHKYNHIHINIFCFHHTSQISYERNTPVHTHTNKKRRRSVRGSKRLHTRMKCAKEKPSMIAQSLASRHASVLENKTAKDGFPRHQAQEIVSVLLISNGRITTVHPLFRQSCPSRPHSTRNALREMRILSLSLSLLLSRAHEHMLRSHVA